MPVRHLRLKPGVNVEVSPFLNELQITASNLIRFYAGFPQKLGGWIAKTVQTFVGTCRGLHGWSDIVGNPYLAIGTEQRLQLLDNGQVVDITPLIATNNPAVSFSTVINTSTVTITDATTTPNVGDWINLLTQVSVGGIVLFGFYQVIASISSTQYQVNAGVNATSTVTNGGAVPAYTTTNTSSTVSVLLANHGFVTGSIFNAAVSTTVATVVISGSLSVTFVDANHFTVVGTGTANANTTASENAGNARIQYLLPSGNSVAVAQSGYGVGAYGGGVYGGAAAGGSSNTTPLRQWALDHFGQDLIASPTNGTIYFWQPPTVQPASTVPNAPLFNTWAFVMPQAQIIVALGAEVGGTQQPLLVRWCDAGDLTDWTATATNQAGSFSISSGSSLVAGLSSGLGAVLWTDLGLWSMTYIGFPLVFGFNSIAQGCGLIAPRAAGSVETLVMWLGLEQFFTYSIGGAVQPVECSVWDFYFYNRDPAQFAQIHCAVNVLFNEMQWFFPLATSSPLFNALAPLGYVKFNYVENVWDFGLSSQYQRTAWAGRSPMGNPIGADTAGLLQQHEQGFDANGQSMMWSWQAGYFQIAPDGGFSYADRLVVDFVNIGNPNIIPNILTVEYPNDTPTSVVVSPPVFNEQTKFLTFSARGSQMSIGFQANAADVGTFWRLGNVYLRAAEDGRQ